VLAGRKTPWQREDQLSEELIAVQRKAILSAQSYVLAELNGTQFNVLRLGASHQKRQTEENPVPSFYSPAVRSF